MVDVTKEGGSNTAGTRYSAKEGNDQENKAPDLRHAINRKIITRVDLHQGNENTNEARMSEQKENEKITRRETNEQKPRAMPTLS